MAKLYSRVNSDIRAGLGCRGNKRMDASIMFSFSGGKTPNGGVKVVAVERGGSFTFKVSVVRPRGEELVYTERFSRKEDQ